MQERITRGQWIGRQCEKTEIQVTKSIIFILHYHEHILIFSSFVFLSLPWSNDEALNVRDTKHKIPLAPLLDLNGVSVCLRLVFDTFEAVFKALDTFEALIKLLILISAFLVDTCLFKLLDRQDSVSDRGVDMDEDIANCNRKCTLFAEAWELMAILPRVGRRSICCSSESILQEQLLPSRTF